MKKKMLCFHLEDHMERIEMDLQVEENNLGILFFDSVDEGKEKNKNELFRQIYNNFFENGNFIKYKFLMDSINISNSHHSLGIQITDYISGIFSSLLRSIENNNNNNDYSKAIQMFFQYIYPNLRKDSNEIIQGFGIKEIPTNKEIRNWLDSEIKKIKNASSI